MKFVLCLGLLLVTCVVRAQNGQPAVVIPEGAKTVEISAATPDTTLLAEAQKVVQQIAATAAARWPNDTSLQVDEIKKQSTAYAWLLDPPDLNVPDTILANLKTQAAAKWPGDYVTQQAEVKKQAEAHSRRQPVPAQGIPPNVLSALKTFVATNWPGNYASQKDELQKQMAAYAWLQGKPDPNLPDKVWLGLKVGVAALWPGDYATQKDELSRRLAASQTMGTNTTDASPPAAPTIITTPPREIITKIRAQVAADYGDSYDAQKLLVQAEADAYVWLHNLEGQGVPPEILEKFKLAAARVYATSYAAQKMMINDQIKTYKKFH